jgi:hypothetical protein
MAIKTLEARKKQQKLLIVSGIIILVAFLVLYFGFLKNGSSTPETTVQPGAKTANILLDEKLKKIDLNTDFLIKTILPALKLYGKTPVEKGTTGRTNPFTAQ